LVKKTKIIFIIDTLKQKLGFLCENDFSFFKQSGLIEIIDLSKIKVANGFLTNPTDNNNIRNQIIENNVFFFFPNLAK
jgi:hypothetical protein